MSPQWNSDSYPQRPTLTARDWLRVIWRAVALGGVVFGGLAVLLLCRLIERPLCGMRRPVTPYITQFVCRGAFLILGITLHIRGAPMTARGAVVANHSSWLDIFALNAGKRVYFVSKSEVAEWPGIGWLARATGTVFIERNRAQAKSQTEIFEARLLAGHKLLFFPEGTSTDGQRVLPFKTTLFQSFFVDGLRDALSIQPVTLRYQAPEGMDSRFYGWWGDMDFAPHLLATLGPARQGKVEVIYGTPLKVAEFANRKALAKACEEAIRAGLVVGESG